MKKVLVTGAKGFLGKNLCANLRLREDITLMEYDLGNTEDELITMIGEADFVYHLAGVNRPTSEEEFKTGNVDFTQRVVDLLREAGKKSPLLITSSIQAERDNPYGRSKKGAEDAAFSYSDEADVFVYRLPNLFGKWCRPNYNSVVATFCHNIAHDLEIRIDNPDHMLSLCYIDDVVKAFVNALAGSAMQDDQGFCHVGKVYNVTLQQLADLIRSFRAIRETGVIPDMGDDFTRILHSTYLSYLDEDNFGYHPTMHSDDRGWLFELIRNQSAGQIFVSLTKPGITRGHHYHHTKVEKFTVIQGEAVIRFRKIDGSDVLEYPVSGSKVSIVDIPPGYTHSIENVGDTDVLTLFWSSELFDPDNPDTIYLKV